MKEQKFNKCESAYTNRLIVTTIAILAVLAAVVFPAKLLGEFVWVIGS